MQERNSFWIYTFYSSFILVIYFLILKYLPFFKREVAYWLCLIVPNLWLIGTTTFLFKLKPLDCCVFKGGFYPRVMAILSYAAIAFLISVCLLLPHQTNPATIQSICSSMLIILLVPLAEELFFRGFLLNLFQKKTGRIISMLIVSSLFGLLHLAQSVYIASAMAALSLISCGAVFISRSLLWAMILHIGWNASAQLRMVNPLTVRLSFLLLIAAIMIILIQIGIKTGYEKKASH